MSRTVTNRQAQKAIFRFKRKLEDGAEDVSYLNITAMMDMMTILLVFLLKSWSVSAASISINDARPPDSNTPLRAADSLKIIISERAVLVDGQEVVSVRGGNIDSSFKLEGANSFLIVPLHEMMVKHATREKKLAELRGEEFAGELSVIADRSTPYRLITEVLYTAGQAEFKNYRLVVQSTTEE